MTPTDKGRFCQSCAKQVVDFSEMSDQQIHNYISNATARLCGRFAEDQLQRPLQPVKQEKKKIWWVAAMMPLMMVFGKVAAQKKKQQQPAPIAIVKQEAIMGDTIIPSLIRPQRIMVIKTAIQIKGKVMNEKGEPVPFATFRVFNQPLTAIADSTGNFIIKLHNDADSIEIEASAVGFENTRIRVNNKEKKDVRLVLKETEKKLPDVVVTGYGIQALVGRVGGLYVIRIVTLAEKIDTVMRQTFHSESFKIFPNPAQKGQPMTIDTKSVGEFSIQMFDNNGKLLQATEFDALEGATQTQFTIPPSCARGVYYIRLVENQTKKQYTNKVVVL
jgi:hypothetical protein